MAMRKQKIAPKQSLKQKWETAVKAVMAKGKTFGQAVMAVERKHPGLRENVCGLAELKREIHFASGYCGEPSPEKRSPMF